MRSWTVVDALTGDTLAYNCMPVGGGGGVNIAVPRPVETATQARRPVGRALVLAFSGRRVARGANFMKENPLGETHRKNP
jgi:hypothetical protein